MTSVIAMSESNVKKLLLERENLILSKYATKSSETKGRLKEDSACPYRTEFQRDRDRIIHCKAFRRLAHKTQVFLKAEGDHYRTRLTHTLEVAQISRTIARALSLNEDLTEAISLAHDLGHTPFGHAGEAAIANAIDTGFKHREQSLRVVDFLEKDGKGLNLTFEVRDGILHHSGEEEGQTPCANIVRLADRIAYLNHDVDDALRAKVIKTSDLPKDVVDLLGENTTKRIDFLIHAIVESSTDGKIVMNKKALDTMNELREFMFKNVYLNYSDTREEDKIPFLIFTLFSYYKKDNGEKLPSFYKTIAEKESLERAVVDYISGMTDHFATNVFSSITVPKSFAIL